MSLSGLSRWVELYEDWGSISGGRRAANPLNWTLLASISIERSNLLLEYQEIGHDVVVRLGGMGGVVLQQSDFKTLVQRLSAGHGAMGSWCGLPPS